MELLKLKCEQCGCEYEKPSVYRKYNEEHPNVFWRRSLQYCDTCRQEKQKEELKSLHEVINALTQNL